MPEPSGVRLPAWMSISGHLVRRRSMGTEHPANKLYCTFEAHTHMVTGATPSDLVEEFSER